jgi:hypothetical protein
MAMTIKEVKEWIGSLDARDDDLLYIDEGGLSLCLLNTLSYCEIGGEPDYPEDLVLCPKCKEEAYYDSGHEEGLYYCISCDYRFNVEHVCDDDCRSNGCKARFQDSDKCPCGDFDCRSHGCQFD